MRSKYPTFDLSLLLLVLSLLLMSCTTFPKEEPVESVKIEYDSTVKPITLEGKTLRSYQVNFKQDISQEAAQKRVQSLIDMTGKSINFDKSVDMSRAIITLRYEKDPSASFELDTRSGNFRYNSGLADYKKDNSTPNLITGEKAGAIALQHLDTLTLLPNKNELQLAHIGGLNMASLKQDKTTEIYQKLVTVRYGRRLAELPVMGDSRIVIHMGSKGQLVGLVYHWAKVIKEHQLGLDQLRSDREIKETLTVRLRKGAQGAKRIIVKKADLVLYDDGRGHIEPAYHIQARLYYQSPKPLSGKQKGIDKYDIPFDYYVPVLKNPMAHYPYMDVAKIQPSDASDRKITQSENE